MKNNVVSFSISEDLNLWLTEYAEIKDLSRSRLIRELIRYYRRTINN